MKIFADSTDLAEIKQLQTAGLIEGITTNPSLIAKSGREMKAVLADICAICAGPVSAEVVATEHRAMCAQAAILQAIAPNIVIKLPLTQDGLTACRTLSADGIKTNITLCFSAVQALWAAKAGATYISPFIGRLDDAALDGMRLIEEIRQVYDNYGFATEILAASIRSVNHLRDAALMGADCATVPPSIISASLKHVLTDKGLADFLADWDKTGQTIE